MDSRDRELLDTLQNDLPLVERPFAALGEDDASPRRRCWSGSTRCAASTSSGRFRAIFDTRRLGYQSSLVAARSQPGRTNETAAVFSAHPGVTHNYRRDHDFDLWFTIAVAPTRGWASSRPSTCSGASPTSSRSACCPACASSRSASTSTWSAAATRAPRRRGASPRCRPRRRPSSTRATSTHPPCRPTCRRSRSLLASWHQQPGDGQCALRRRAGPPQRRLRAERHGRVEGRRGLLRGHGHHHGR